MTMTRVFAPITKTEKLPDGSRLVYGKMTGTDLDQDGQRFDADFLKAAVPDWFKIGNVREMHQAWAVGKAMDVDVDGDDYYLTAKIVDAEACKKLDAEIYTGFSIGVRGPKIRQDASAPNGLIYGGKIIETSLADAPCNDTCKLILVKSIGGHTVLTKSDAVADPADTTGSTETETDVADATDEGDPGAADDAEEVVEVDLIGQLLATIDTLLAGEVAELADGTGTTGPVSVLISIRDMVQWFVDCDNYDDMATRRNTIEAALAGEEETLNLTTLATLTKAATADTASATDKTAVADLRKALGIDDLSTKLATELTKAATAEDLTKVAVRLAKVETTVIQSGPSRVRVQEDANKAIALDHHLTEANRLNQLAASVADRELADAYRVLAQRELASAT